MGIPGSPQVSVVLPVWNREVEVRHAVESVLAQTYPDLELILVDDGSTDRTGEVVEDFADPRTRVLHQEHGGVCQARNLGASMARGRWVTFLDSDDEALPNWLERFVEVLGSTSAQAVVCGAIEVDPSRRQWTTELPMSWGPAFGDFPGPFLAGTFGIELDVFRSLGGYATDLAFSENTELALRLAVAAESRGWHVASIDEPLVIHYQRAERSYGSARYDAARYLLDHHEARLAADRRTTGLYHGIAGVGAAALGRRADARRELWRAVRSDPKRLAHLRRLLAVSTGLQGRLRRPGLSQAAAPVPEVAQHSRLHAVAVTYRRPEDLRRTLEAILDPRHGLASVTVVDNDPDRSAERVVAELTANSEVSYLPSGDNLGPAGGLAIGIDRVLQRASEGDWIAVIDDDDPPAEEVSLATLHELAEWLRARGAPVGLVGLVGGRLDRRRARFTRVPQRELHGPVPVDFVGGGQLPVISVAALRVAGSFRPELFFGFDDLDLGLRMQRHGFAVFAHGEEWARARARSGRTGDAVPAAPRRTSVWRRYYSVRNLIVVLRDEVGLVAALVATLTNVLGRPVADLRRRRDGSLRYAVIGARAGVDAWTRRLGRRVEPHDG